MTRRFASALVAGSIALAGFPAPLVAQGGVQVVGRILWRVRVGSRPDLMSTLRNDERDGFPNDGQVYYLSKFHLAGTAPLHRLYHPNWGGHMDHMDSLTPNEGGFLTEPVLGFPFTSGASAYGLAQYVRTYNPGNGDHGNRSIHESPAPGYRDEPLGAYGWPRWPDQSTSLLSLQAGGVTIESNRVSGGALWHWTHDGVQYVNNRDYGRQIQSSIFFARDGKTANPTEAGDRWGDVSRPAWARHGSPLAAGHNSGATQVTRAVPLDFNPDFFGGDSDHPVIYKDIMLGKDITLNYNNLGPVAKYTTVLTSPGLPHAGIEVPTGYLSSEFYRFWTYDAGTRSLREVFPPSACAEQTQFTTFAPDYGGVIIGNGSASHAMGVYGVKTSRGGSVSFFRLYNFFCAGDGPGEFKFDTAKWTAIREGSVPSGAITFDTWIMTGSVSEVTRYMDAIRSGTGGSGCGSGFAGTTWWRSIDLSHQMGRRDGSSPDWTANVVQDSAGFLVYGPYDASWGGGSHTATFDLWIDNNSADDAVVATLDVVTDYGRRVLARRDIRRREFASPGGWQRFSLGFNDACFGLVETRVFWHDRAWMKAGMQSVTH